MARSAGYAKSGRDYAQFDNQCDEHAKIAALSDKLHRIWHRSVLYCSRNLTDGLLPASIVKDRGWLRHATDLVEARVWDRQGDDYAVHDYLDWNDSKADVEKRIERARAGGLARAQLQAQPQAELQAQPNGQPQAQLKQQRKLSTALLSSSSSNSQRFRARAQEADPPYVHPKPFVGRCEKCGCPTGHYEGCEALATTGPAPGEGFDLL